MSSLLVDALAARMAALEAELKGLATREYGGLDGTDQTIKGSHDRLDSLLGAGVSAPDGTLITSLNADMVDGYHAVSLAPAWASLPPAAPNAEDDEFTAAALDGKWTETSSAGAHDHATTWPSHIFVQFTGNQSYNLSQAYAIGTSTWSITACFRFAVFANTQGAFVYAYDADESDGMAISYQYSGGWATKLSSKEGVWTARTTTTVAEHSTVYIHLQRNASNVWVAYISRDGYSWTFVGTYTKSVTIDHFEIELNMGGATRNCIAGIDWVRRDWLTL